MAKPNAKRKSTFQRDDERLFKKIFNPNNGQINKQRCLDRLLHSLDTSLNEDRTDDDAA